MRDYDNMPVLDWGESQTPVKARAQILHQEPVILQMPDDFDTSFDTATVDCKFQEDTGIFYNCDGAKTLDLLANQNHLSGLHDIAKACNQSGSQVDIDRNHKRI